MILPFFRRITEEDLADAPKGAWKGKMLYAINLFFQQLYAGLSNNLTPEQNCIAQTKTFEIIGSSTAANNVYSFATSYSYSPLGVDILNIQVASGNPQVFTVAPYVTWIYANGRLNILGIAGLTDSVIYTVTLRIWWPAIIN